MKKYVLFDDETLKAVKTVYSDDPEKIGVRHKKEVAIVGVFLLLAIGAIIGIAHLRHSNTHDYYKAEIAAMEDRMNVIENKADLMSLVGYYTVTKNTDPLTDSAVFAFLQECKAWYPDVIMAQYIVESGRGTSNVYRHSFNMFGMKVVSRRPTTQLPHTSYSGYGMYNNWQMSAIDHVLWDYWTFSDIKPTRDQYIAKLGAIYAEDPGYMAKVRELADQYNNK